MPFDIGTGQLDLDGLKSHLTKNLSGSETNTTGWYPYAGNPSGFANSGYVDSISGDISGYIDAVSGILSARIAQTGVDVSGELFSISGTLNKEIDIVSGDLEDLSGDYDATNTRSLANEQHITELTGTLNVSGEKLMVLLTGVSGDGISGFVTGFVNTTSGVLNTKISDLNTNLKDHVSSDFLSKKDGTAGVSGEVEFRKTPHFNKGLYVDRVDATSDISTIQSGFAFYSHRDSITENSISYHRLTNYLRMPDSGTNQIDTIVNSYMYNAANSPIP
jgi:hypothetical protein